jgi:hypothetical protein
LGRQAWEQQQGASLKYWASLRPDNWLFDENIDDFLSQLSRAQFREYHREPEVIAGWGNRIFTHRISSPTSNEQKNSLEARVNGDKLVFIFRLMWIRYQLSPILPKRLNISSTEWRECVTKGTFRISETFGNKTKPSPMAGQYQGVQPPSPTVGSTFKLRKPKALAIDDKWNHRYGVIPVGDGNSHFFTLVVDFEDHIIYMYDLLLAWNPRGLRSETKLTDFTDNLMKIVGDALTHATENEIPIHWTRKIVWGTQPLQKDGSSCGIIVCVIAWLTVLRRRPPTYDELMELDRSMEGISKIRAWMAYSSLHDRLWLPPENEVGHHALAP